MLPVLWKSCESFTGGDTYVKKIDLTKFCRSSYQCWVGISFTFLLGVFTWPCYWGLCDNGLRSNLSSEVTLTFEILIKLLRAFIPMGIPLRILWLIWLKNSQYCLFSLLFSFLLLELEINPLYIVSFHTAHTGIDIQGVWGRLPQRNLESNVQQPVLKIHICLLWICPWMTFSIDYDLQMS